MATQSLTLEFAGICTHFRDVVPGVPHRVVLPDASALRFGQIHLEWSSKLASFALAPHFAFLRTPKNVEQLTVPDVMSNGYLLAGARIQIANAIGDQINDLSFDRTPSITEFVSDYSWSEDVVMGGRAACYFDVFAGKVQTEPLPKGATRVRIDIETDGPPVLLLTPFDQKIQPAKITLDTDTLFIANLELESSEDDPHFDYLLHYLTARAGIPSRILKPTPGMGLNPPLLTEESVARALRELTSVIAAGRPSDEQLARILPGDIGPACSDSRYP